MISSADSSPDTPGLSPAKRALLEERLRGDLKAVTSAPVMARRERKGPSPLSFAQHRLWFLHQIDPRSPLYNMPLVIRISGPLAPGLLEHALNLILARHEVLRTRFVVADGNPVQVAVEGVHISLPLVEFDSSLEGEHESVLDRLIKEEAWKPFDLSKDLMLRARLIRSNAAEHVLLLTMHHIAADAWSLGVCFQELQVIYGALSLGETPHLPGLPIQYADFALWQKQWLQGKVLDLQLEYWKEQLAGGSARLKLPADHSRSDLPSRHGALLTLQMPRPLGESMKRLSQQESCTLFMSLLTAYYILLYRYTGRMNIQVGSPIAGRTRRETEGLIGFFVNTLVLRCDLSGDPSCRELLHRVRRMTLDACEHQELPFEKLVEALQPERSLNRMPLIQTMFMLQDSITNALKLPGLTVRTAMTSTDTSKFDLTLSVADSEEGLAVEIEFSRDLFDPATIQRMAEHYRTLLEDIVRDPDQKISRLSLLPESERWQVLEGWNRTGREFSRRVCLHQLFEAQVARAPEATALVWKDQRLSYGELNRQANRLAHQLKRLGVGPESLVALCLERTPWLVAGVLAVLKAGGAYVPVDPVYPKERLQLVIEDSRAIVLLTQCGLVDRFQSAGGSFKCLCVDAEAARMGAEADENPESGVRPENLAYVIYTSGSTGNPKGVAIEHHSPVNLVEWAQQEFTEAETAGMLFGTSICFDLSVFEMFLPLSRGGKIILAENALQLTGLSAASEVTLVNTVPSVMKELTRQEAVPDTVLTINLAGEPLRVELVREIYERTAVRKVCDLYGPSETTTYSTWARREPNGPYTIGRPIANTRVYVLDGNCQPVPIGVTGEIYIGGEGVARGYLNQPELTAERFLANPFDLQPGSRLYKTGDLGRYRADGDLEYLGRLDHQVKIRGFRIELGEIESVLRQQEGVEEVVVEVRGEGTGKRLVAYVVADRSVTEDRLRGYLEARLPQYMVPSVYMKMERFPLTPSGKIDRKMLPEPEPGVGGVRTEYEAPGTPTERVIAGVWCEVLGLPQVGVNDNFFALGGHSLLATRVISRLCHAFQIELPLRFLFEKPTVAALAIGVEELLIEQIKSLDGKASETVAERL